LLQTSWIAKTLLWIPYCPGINWSGALPAMTSKGDSTMRHAHTTKYVTVCPTTATSWVYHLLYLTTTVLSSFVLQTPPLPHLPANLGTNQTRAVMTDLLSHIWRAEQRHSLSPVETCCKWLNGLPTRRRVVRPASTASQPS
jgi:hypothetical protein